MIKIAFVWNWDRASEIMPNWRDGLRAAIEHIAEDNQVDWYLDKKLPENDDHDFVLFWDDSNSSVFNVLDRYPKARKGICLTTDPHNMDNLRKLDVVFCESKPIYEAVRANGIRAIRAFGTDVSFFKPQKAQKTIEFFYPATFSPWKQQSTIAHLGDRLLCVGTVQPDGVNELQACLDLGVRVEQGYFPAEKIRDYYAAAKNVIIPAIHGSERTVLEAMAMNILPKVNEENIRTHSYIDEYHESGARTPRDFVINYYSHYIYADHLMKGIMQ